VDRARGDRNIPAHISIWVFRVCCVCCVVETIIHSAVRQRRNTSVGHMNEGLQRYIDQATAIIERLKDTKSQDLQHIVDVIRMGRGIMTQQARENESLRNELTIKSETIKQMLSRRPLIQEVPKEPA